MTWICIWQMSCGGWASLLSGEAAIAGSPWREPWVLFVGCDKRSRFPDGVPARAMNEFRECPLVLRSPRWHTVNLIQPAGHTLRPIDSQPLR
jgi:hypothetical protein